MNDNALGVRLNNRGKYIAVGLVPFDMYRKAASPTREQQVRAHLYNAAGLGKDSKWTAAVLRQLFPDPETDFTDQSRPLSDAQQACLNKVISLVRERERLSVELNRLTVEFRDQPGPD